MIMAALAIELREADKKFREYFNTSFQQFEDRMLSVVFGQPMIDIAKFDEYLDIPDGSSMEETIILRYGKQAMEWFNKTFIDL